MRHIVYLLLVANIVYLAWNVLQLSPHDEVARSLPPLPATATRLVTLQEVEEVEEGEEEKQDEENQEVIFSCVPGTACHRQDVMRIPSIDPF